MKLPRLYPPTQIFRFADPLYEKVPDSKIQIPNFISPMSKLQEINKCTYFQINKLAKSSYCIRFICFVSNNTDFVIISQIMNYKVVMETGSCKDKIETLHDILANTDRILVLGMNIFKSLVKKCFQNFFHIYEKIEDKLYSSKRVHFTTGGIYQVVRQTL